MSLILHVGKNVSIDATLSTCLAKYVNDSPHEFANCKLDVFEVNDVPHLFLVATDNVLAGSELRYPYKHEKELWWREKVEYCKPLFRPVEPDVTFISENDIQIVKAAHDKIMVSDGEVSKRLILTSVSTCALKDPFFKVDDKSRLYRPIYYEGKFPTIDEPRSPCKTPDKTYKYGYCECCEISFQNLKEHLEGMEHQKFVSNPDNYDGVDAIIAQVNEKSSIFNLFADSKTMHVHNCDVDSQLHDELTVEQDKDLHNHLKSYKNIQDIPVDIIGEMMDHLSDQIISIFEGKVYCERHERYKAGGQEKVCILKCQGDMIADKLFQKFTANDMKYFDYVHKVLLPESMILVYCLYSGLNRCEADKLLIYESDNDDNNQSDVESEEGTQAINETEKSDGKIDFIRQNDTNIEPVVNHPVVTKNIEPVINYPVVTKNIEPVVNHPVVTKNTEPVVNHPVVTKNTEPVVNHLVVTKNTEPVVNHLVVTKNTEPVVNHPVVTKNIEPVVNHPVVTKKNKNSDAHQSFKCPVSGCGIQVINLPRHLLLKHKWSKASCEAAVGQFSLRKNTATVPTTPKKGKRDYHISRICPVKGCYKVLKRLPKHLLVQHKLPRDTEYFRLLKEAKSFKANILPQTVTKSPRALFSKRKRVNSPNKTANDDDNACSSPLLFKSYSAPLSPKRDGGEYDEDSDYVPSDEEDETIKERLPQKIRNLLENFKIYMQCPDGGNRSSFIQICDDVKRIYLVLCKHHPFSMFFDVKHFRDTYLMSHCKSRNSLPGTIKKYLISVDIFCEYLITEGIQITDVPSSAILDLKLKINGWRKSYQKMDRKRKWKREVDDFSMLVTPEQVQTYESSDNAVTAKDLFSQLQEGNFEINQTQYCKMRDHLFSVIHFANGHRSGVSANLLVSEFNGAIKLGSVYEILVKNHKTAHVYGPATITLNEEEYGWLNTFVLKVRPQLKSKNENVFLSWSGSSMDPGQISLRIHQLWVKGGIFEKDPIKNLTCNIIRKSTTTGIRDRGLGCTQEVADLMGHSVDTAESHYFIRKKQQTAVKGAEVVRAYFRTVPEDNNESIPSSPKHAWTVSDISNLQRIFSEELQRNSISIVDVRRKFNQWSQFFTTSEKQVYDKVRSLMRYSPNCKKQLALSKSSTATNRSYTVTTTETAKRRDELLQSIKNENNCSDAVMKKAKCNSNKFQKKVITRSRKDGNKLCQEKDVILKKVLNGDMPCFIKQYVKEEIGYGVYTTEDLKASTILLEYKGELISTAEANRRQEIYEKEMSGCFLYHFHNHKGQTMCIDATRATTLGKMVNDSPARHANCTMKLFVVEDIPHLCLVSVKNIKAFAELRYDYGDKPSNMPWRRQVLIDCIEQENEKTQGDQKSTVDFKLLSKSQCINGNLQIQLDMDDLSDASDDYTKEECVKMPHCEVRDEKKSDWMKDDIIVASSNEWEANDELQVSLQTMKDQIEDSATPLTQKTIQDLVENVAPLPENIIEDLIKENTMPLPNKVIEGPLKENAAAPLPGKTIKDQIEDSATPLTQKTIQDLIENVAPLPENIIEDLIKENTVPLPNKVIEGPVKESVAAPLPGKTIEDEIDRKIDLPEQIS